MRLLVVRLEPQCRLIFLDRIRIPARLEPGVAQIVVHLRIVRHESQRLVVMLDRLRDLAGVQQRVGQVVVGPRVVWIELQRRPAFFDRLRQPAHLAQDIAVAAMGLDVVSFDPQGRLILPDRIGKPSRRVQLVSQPAALHRIMVESLQDVESQGEDQQEHPDRPDRHAPARAGGQHPLHRQDPDDRQEYQRGKKLHLVTAAIAIEQAQDPGADPKEGRRRRDDSPQPERGPPPPGPTTPAARRARTRRPGCSSKCRRDLPPAHDPPATRALRSL